MGRYRRGQRIHSVLVTVDEIVKALESYGCKADPENVARSVAWVIACAQSAADAALEDIARGRVGLTGSDEDLLDPERVRQEEEESLARFVSGSRQI